MGGMAGISRAGQQRNPSCDPALARGHESHDLLPRRCGSPVGGIVHTAGSQHSER